MGKKGKGANKLAKMSEEERARYLQHRADMEEEAQRRKQQLIAVFMKNKLKREEAFSRLNLAKINQEWRSTLRQMKCKELKEDLNGMAIDFMDALKRKDLTIQRLLGDLDEAEEMYGTMIHSHMENIEKLIYLHGSRLDFWQQNYYNEKKSLIQQHNIEIERSKERKSIAQENLESVFYGLENIREQQIESFQDFHLKKVDNLKSGMILKLEILTENREQNIEKLWKSLQNYLNAYLKYTEEFHTEYVEQKQKDDEDTKCIRHHYLYTCMLTEQIGELKLELEILRDDQNLRVMQLQKMKKILYDKHCLRKCEMISEINNDQEKLKDLVMGSHATTTKLKDILKVGQNINHIMKICNKYEIEQNNDRLPASNYNNNNPSQIPLDEKRERRPGPAGIDENTFSLLSHGMDNFWIRFNNARLDCTSLENENPRLMTENHNLKLKLKEYLTNVTLLHGIVINPADTIAAGNLFNKMHQLKKSRNLLKVNNDDRLVHIDLIDVNSDNDDGGGVMHHRHNNNNNRMARPATCIEGNLTVAVRSHYICRKKNPNRISNIFSI